MKTNNSHKDIKVEVNWQYTELTPAMQRLLSLLLTPRKEKQQTRDGNGEKTDEREYDRPDSKMR